ncbi:MAG: O-antigen ligase family protein [Candidatus Falkowbacteria bacterium]
MKKFLEHNFKYLFYIFLFALPWQTRLFLYQGQLKNEYSEFLSVSLYGSDIILLVLLLVAGIIWFNKFKAETKPEFRKNKLWWALAALDAVFLVSAFLAGNRLVAFYHYFLFLAGVALFLILSQTKHFHLNKIKTFYVLLSSLFLHAVLGIYQFLSQSTFACKYLGLAQHLPYSLAGESVLENSAGRWLRSYGGFDHPNIFGVMMVFAILLCIYLLLHHSQNKKWLNLNVVFLFSFTLALFFSFSRGAWLALSAAFVVWILVEYQKSILIYRSKFFRQPLFWGLLLLLLIFFLEYGNLVATRVSATDRLEAKSISERIDYLVDAKNLIQSNWLIGVGPGNYVEAALKINPSQAFWYYQPVHNYFVLLFAELGVFGLLFWLAFLTLLLWRLSIERRGHGFNLALGAVLLTTMMLEHFFFSLHFGILMLWIILGLIYNKQYEQIQNKEIKE